MSIKRIVIISDVHINEDDPIHPSYKAVKNFLKVYKPDHLYINGDFFDFGMISHWVKELPGLTEGKRLKTEIDNGRSELEFLVKYSKTVSFLAGNHETRIQKFLEESPIFKGLIDLPILLQLEDLGIDYIPESEQPIKIANKLHLTHGTMTGLTYTRSMALKYKDSIIQGHTHRSQQYTTSYSYRGKDIETQEVYGSGCLSDIYQPFHGQTNFGHSNGFIIIDLDTDINEWQVNNIIIKNGSFFWNGKKYSA